MFTSRVLSQNSFFQKHAILFLMIGLLIIIATLILPSISRGTNISPAIIDPYVLSTQGKTLIIREKIIAVNENWTGAIQIGDRIKTLAASAATIFWPDGSVTRLGEKSSIKIRGMEASSTNEAVKIDFSLEQGKSWSNIVRYLFGDSYFHERYNNDTTLAAVRGTVFEIDLDRKYIHTVDHAVTLEELRRGSGSSILAAGAIIDTENRRALTRAIIDEEWNKLNRNEDLIYINSRIEAFNKAVLGNIGQKNYFEKFLQSIGMGQTLPIDSLLNGDEATWMDLEKTIANSKDTEKIHASLLNFYERINAFPNTPTYLESKIKLRDMIIQTAAKDQKNAFLTDFARLTLYDTWKTDGDTSLQKVLESKLQEYVKNGADKNMIERLNASFKNKTLSDWNDSIEEIKQKMVETLGKENYMKKVTDSVTQENLEKVNDKATEVRQGFMEKLNALFR